MDDLSWQKNPQFKQNSSRAKLKNYRIEMEKIQSEIEKIQSEMKQFSVFNNETNIKKSSDETEQISSSKNIKSLNTPNISFKNTILNKKAQKEIASKLKPGDILVQRAADAAIRTSVEKANYWIQNKFQKRLETSKMKFEEEDKQSNHVAMVTYVDEETGTILISEETDAGARTFDYFRHLSYGIHEGNVQEFFRLNIPGVTGSVNDIAVKVLKSQTRASRYLYTKNGKTKEGKTLYKSNKRTEGSAKQGTAYQYSQLKALRAVVKKGFGTNATHQKITQKMLKQYQRFITNSRSEGTDTKKRTSMCSQIVSSSLQLSTFKLAVDDLKHDNQDFQEHLAKFENSNLKPNNKEFKKFIKSYGEMIFNKMINLVPNIGFNPSNMSPTDIRALLRNINDDDNNNSPILVIEP